DAVEEIAGAREGPGGRSVAVHDDALDRQDAGKLFAPLARTQFDLQVTGTAVEELGEPRLLATAGQGVRPKRPALGHRIFDLAVGLRELGRGDPYAGPRRPG